MAKGMRFRGRPNLVSVARPFGALVALLLAAGCGSSTSPATSGTSSTPKPSAATTYSIQGTFVLTDASTANAGCQGQGGYSDISFGTQITVTNENMTVIGTGPLQFGTPNDGHTMCTYKFGIDNLPKASFYGLTISHRGTQTYSFSDLSGNGWMIDLTLGS